MTDLIKTHEYKKWLTELNNRLLKVQLKAVVAVNMDYHTAISQQPVDQLPKAWDSTLISKITAIPWDHNIAIIAKCKTRQTRLLSANNL